MVGGQTDAKLSIVLRNEQTMGEYLQETRNAQRKLEAEVQELKDLVMTFTARIDEQSRAINLLRAKLLGGGPT